MHDLISPYVTGIGQLAKATDPLRGRLNTIDGEILMLEETVHAAGQLERAAKIIASRENCMAIALEIRARNHYNLRRSVEEIRKSQNTERSRLLHLNNLAVKAGGFGQCGANTMPECHSMSPTFSKTFAAELERTSDDAPTERDRKRVITVPFTSHRPGSSSPGDVFPNPIDEVYRHQSQSLARDESLSMPGAFCAVKPLILPGVARRVPSRNGIHPRAYVALQSPVQYSSGSQIQASSDVRG